MQFLLQTEKKKERKSKNITFIEKQFEDREDEENISMKLNGELR